MNAGADSCVRPCPWHRESWQRLQRALESGRLAHALLFPGVPGTGRLRFATALARQLLCEEAGAAGNCGSCKSCRLLAQGAHADFFALAPAEPGKRIGVDAVRELLAFSARTSAFGARKVVLVTQLEAFTGNAFNAFLKGLEEPADDSFLLLVTARGQELPATIRSRCQALPLAAPDTQESLDWLQEALAAAREAPGVNPQQLLRCLPGRPLAALARVQAGEAAPLLALQRALDERGDAASLQRAAAALPEAELLEQLQRRLAQRCRDAARRGERRKLQRALRSDDRLRALRRALLAGSNPNPELLRHAALSAWCAVDGCDDGATLGPSAER